MAFDLHWVFLGLGVGLFGLPVIAKPLNTESTVCPFSQCKNNTKNLCDNVIIMKLLVIPFIIYHSKAKYVCMQCHGLSILKCANRIGWHERKCFETEMIGC